MAGLITRFAPSPTGPLHLGHAFSALTAYDLARSQNGQFLLRIEDIDTPRCRPAFEAQIYDDLHWLGLDWPLPVMRQSERRAAYASALAQLNALGVTYGCTCTRGDIRAALSAPQEGTAPTGPDGPIYPGTCRHQQRDPEGAAIRLNMARATALIGSVTFVETGPLHTGSHIYTPEWLTTHVGDVVLARRDIGTSYHLAVSVDDAAQDISLVVRGVDLFEATAIHTVLQRLLDLPTPEYHHHRLIRDTQGKRLAKRDAARALSLYRDDGLTPEALRESLAL
ncbi:tRNA glutamyl-Q(34) synthetase GluQRS [Pararhodobacter sp.]|uniref:tRNA glutamyl-Q(34) synthetase GluQRS n=1 Tax=Pararhodobacter sp. TaxID=2127056 RepID=UPI002AFEA4EE|nr:tRNA glutamyl-Q(34) synthetase GluQRS [Pararhodobacter sp.]